MHAANWMRTSRYILSVCLSVSLFAFLFATSVHSISRSHSLYLFIHFSASSISLMLTCNMRTSVPTNAFRDNCKRFSHLHGMPATTSSTSFINMCVCVCVRVCKNSGKETQIAACVNEFDVILQLTVSENVTFVLALNFLFIRRECVCNISLSLSLSRDSFTHSDEHKRFDARICDKIICDKNDWTTLMMSRLMNVCMCLPTSHQKLASRIGILLDISIVLQAIRRHIDRVQQQ